jgi:hypothetical protein
VAKAPAFAVRRKYFDPNYGISVLRTGEGTFRGLKVKLLPRARTTWKPYSRKLTAADFVTVCSLSLSFFGQIKQGGIGHAVTVSRLKIQKEKVTIKLYSWGDSMQGTFPLRSFLTYYRGNVADPLDKSN